jgi:hypothetical protein
VRLEISVCFFSFYILESDIPGGDSGGATPLPIPNRDVKPSRADGTVLVTAWESRSLPGFSFGLFGANGGARTARARRREAPVRRTGRSHGPDSRSVSFFVDMYTGGGIISASMALATHYRTIRILSGTFQSAPRSACSFEIQKREEVKPNE